MKPAGRQHVADPGPRRVPCDPDRGFLIIAFEGLYTEPASRDSLQAHPSSQAGLARFLPAWHWTLPAPVGVL